MTQVTRPGPWIGRAVRRREDQEILRGRAVYLDDIELTGTAHVAFARSPHAHARIAAVSLSAAEQAPGVLGVFSAASLAGALPALASPLVEGQQLPAAADHPVLASDRARYVGQPVAAVVAATRALAEDAAELIDIEYVPLPPVLGVREAQTSATLVHEEVEHNVFFRGRKGSSGVPEAFARADQTIRGRFHIPRLVAAPLEARGAIAAPQPDGTLQVWCSAQDVHRPLAGLQQVLARPPETIRVIIPAVGGAFGSKGNIGPEVALTAFAALELDRPVKWAEDRRENFLSAYQGRGLDADVELAVTTEGRIAALRARLYADLGAYALPDTPYTPFITARLLTGVYAIEAAEVEVIGVATTKVPTGPYRGAGRPEAAFLLERAVDIAAGRLGLDPIRVRRANLIPRDAFPYPSPVGTLTDPGDYDRCLDLVLERLDVEGWRRAAQDEGRLIGIGVALVLEDCAGDAEGAVLAVQPDGATSLWISASPHGQGHVTTFAQIVAEHLGTSPDEVEVRWGDSATAPRGAGTYGSRAVSMCGSAVMLAATDIREQLAALGGRRQEALRAEAVFAGELIFSTGAYGAVVEIDERTGRLTVIRLVAVDDAGRVINPLLAEGQVVGGAVQGLGQAVCEEVRYDEAGQPLTTSFADYLLPTAADVPEIDALFVETPTTETPLGARGLGEAGTIGAPAALANALADALAAFDVTHVDMPFTAEKLWTLIQKGRKEA